MRGTLEITDRATGQAYALSGFDALDELNPSNDVDGGFESDAWDYFVIGLSGSFDDFDWIIDNFKVEQFGSNAVVSNADFNNDGTVDGNDFLVWQRGVGLTGQSDRSTGDANGDGIVNAGDLEVWKMQFGTSPAVVAATGVPEPATGLILLGALGFFPWARKRFGR